MRIYGKGLEQFGSEVAFIVHYLNFLLSINDENSKFSLSCKCVRAFR